MKNPVYFYPGAFHFILLCSVLAPLDSSSFCLLSACPFVSLSSLVLLSFFIFSRVFLVCSYPGVFLFSTWCFYCFNKVRCLCFLVDGPHAQMCLFVRWGWCAIVKPGSWGFLGSDVFSFVNPGSWGFVGSEILVRGLYEMLRARCHTRAHGSCPDSSQKKARVLIPMRAPGICHWLLLTWLLLVLWNIEDMWWMRLDESLRGLIWTIYIQFSISNASGNS